MRRNLVGYVALFVALGGTGYAAVNLPPNSVGTAQLKPGAVIASKVKDHSLLAKNFKAGQLPEGPAGPPGTTIVAKPRGSTAVTVAPKTNGDFQMSNNTWTQHAGEIDRAIAQIAYTPPATCGSDTTPSFTTVQLLVDGTAVFSPFFMAASSKQTLTLDLPPMFEPTSDTPHTLTVRVMNSCPDPGQSFTLSSVAVDVVAVR